MSDAVLVLNAGSSSLKFAVFGVGDALRQATASDTCTVIEIMCTEELGDPFRRDALKKPHRLLDKYKDFTVD